MTDNSNTIIRIAGPIRQHSNASQEPYHEVGTDGVTKIVEYLECGGLGPAMWFEVYKDGHKFTRVNSFYVAEVFYAEPKP